jgi:hypothetical protein
VTAAEDGGANDQQLAALLKRHGLPVLRKRIAVFVGELRAKG